MPTNPFDIDAAEDYDDGTKAITYSSDEDAQEVAGLDQNRATASKLRVQNWDDASFMESPAYQGKVVKRSELEDYMSNKQEPEGDESPDEDAMEGWSEAEPFGESEEEDDASDEDKKDANEDANDAIRNMEQEDSAQLMRSKDTTQVLDKAKHVRNQKRVWEKALEVQIYTKRLLTSLQSSQGTDSSSIAEKLRSCITNIDSIQTSLSSAMPELAHESSLKKRKREDPLDELWDAIQADNSDLQTPYSTILNRHTRQTNLSSTSQSNKFKAVNQEIMSQVDAVLADKQRVKRKAHAPLDTTNETDEELDETTYDDSDFYQQLLKELIEAGGSNQSAEAISRRAKKKRKNVNRKASKGRQLRYAVHPKLENFMFPEPYAKPSMDVDELVRSLFGQRRAE